MTDKNEMVNKPTFRHPLEGNLRICPSSKRSNGRLNGNESSPRPVVRLKLALYGHPLAGLHWEKHAADAVKRCGFEAVQDWECMCYHKDLGLMLGIYVDDFKPVGREDVAGKGVGTP